MINKTVLKSLAKALAFTLLINFNACWADEKQNQQVSKISAFIGGAANKIGGTNKVGANLNPNWSENPEFAEVFDYGTDKRIATLWAIIDLLNKNEEVIFPQFKSDSKQMAATIIMRTFELNYLKKLISISANDVVVEDYLDRENADLKLVLNEKISTAAYYQSRELRNNKLYLIFMGDEKILREFLVLLKDKNGIATVLANKTTLVSLLEMCLTNPELCVKL
jgi:hypothetical protein